jgi:hypothetical protein
MRTIFSLGGFAIRTWPSLQTPTPRKKMLEQENRFTGWTNVDLSRRGRDEALQAGLILKSYDYCFDCAFTSVLKRAIRTLWIVLDQLDLMWIPVKKSWRLNERLEPLARYYLGDSSVAAQAQQAPEHLVKADSGL